MKFVQDTEVITVIVDGQEHKSNADIFDVSNEAWEAFQKFRTDDDSMTEAAERANVVFGKYGLPKLTTSGCYAFLRTLNARCMEIKKKDLSMTFAGSPGTTDSGPAS